MIEDRGSNAALEESNEFDQLVSTTASDASSGADAWSRVGTLTGSAQTALKWSGQRQALAIPIAARCIWILSGENCDSAISALHEVSTLLSTATRLCMMALAVQMQEAERTLNMLSLTASVRLASLLGETRVDGVAKNIWSEIPLIIENAINSIGDSLGNPSAYTVDLFRAYPNANGVSYTMPLTTLSARHEQLISHSPGSLPMTSMEKQACLSMAFRGNKNGADVALYESDVDNSSLFAIRGDTGSALVVLPVMLAQGSDAESDDSSDDFCPGFIAFTKILSPGISSDGADGTVSAKEIAHIESLCAVLMHTLFNWMSLHTIDKLIADDASHLLPSFKSRSHIIALDTLNAAWLSYVRDEGKVADESLCYFLSQLRGDGPSRSTNEILASSGGGLTEMAASCMGCSWASAVLVAGASDDLLVMDDVGSVRHEAAIGAHSLSSAEALEEKRLEQIFGLQVMQYRLEAPVKQSGFVRADESFAESSGVHMFQGIDILKSSVLKSTLSDKFRQKLERATQKHRRKGASSWCIVMAVLPLDDVISAASGRSLVLFGGREWHPRKEWSGDGSVRSLASSFMVRLRTLLSLLDDARVCSEKVNRSIPMISSELRDLRDRQDVADLEYSSVQEISSRLTRLLATDSNEMLQPSLKLRTQLWHCIADTLHTALSGVKSRDGPGVSFELWMYDGVDGGRWVLHPENRDAWLMSSRRDDAGYWVDIELYALPLDVECPAIDNMLDAACLNLRIRDCDLFSGSYGRIIRCSSDINSICERRAVAAWVQQLRAFFNSFEKEHSRSLLLQKLCSASTVGQMSTSTSIGSAASILAVECKYSYSKNGPLRDFMQTFEFASHVSADALASCPAVGSLTDLDPVYSSPESLWQQSSAAGAAYFGSRAFWDKTLSGYLRSVRSLPVSAVVLPIALFKVESNDKSSAPVKFLGRDLIADDSCEAESSGYLPKDIVEYLVEDLKGLGRGSNAHIMSASGSAVVERYLSLRHLDRSAGFTAEKRRAYLGTFTPGGITLLVKGPLEEIWPEEAIAGDTFPRASSTAHCSVGYHVALHISVQAPLVPHVLNILIGAIQASMLPLLSLSSAMTLQQCAQDLQALMFSALDGTKPEMMDPNSPIKLGDNAQEKLFRKTIAGDWHAMVRLLQVSGEACSRALGEFERTLCRLQSPSDSEENKAATPAPFVAYVASEDDKYVQCDAFNKESISNSLLPASIPLAHPLLSNSLSSVMCASAVDEVETTDDAQQAMPICEGFMLGRFVAGLVEIPNASSSPKRLARSTASPKRTVSFLSAETDTMGTTSAAAKPVAARNSRHFLRISYFLSRDEAELVLSASRSSLTGTVAPHPLVTGASSMNPFRSFAPGDSFASPDKNAFKSFDFGEVEVVDEVNKSPCDILFAVILLPLSAFTSTVLLSSIGKSPLEMGSSSGIAEDRVSDGSMSKIVKSLSPFSRRVFDRVEWLSRCTLIQLQLWMHRTHQTTAIQNVNRNLVRGHEFRGASFSDWTNENIKDLFEKAKTISMYDIDDGVLAIAEETGPLSEGPEFDLMVSAEDAHNVAELSRMKRAVESTLRSLLARYQDTALRLRLTESSLSSMTADCREAVKRCDVRDAVVHELFEALMKSGLAGAGNSQKAFSLELTNTRQLVHRRAYTWPDSTSDIKRGESSDGSVLQLVSMFTDRVNLHDAMLKEFIDLFGELGLRDEATRRVVRARQAAASVIRSDEDIIDVYWASADLSFSVPFHCEEQQDMVVLARALPPMSTVRFPSMFQWVIASGQPIDANSGTEANLSTKKMLTEQRPEVTRYIPILALGAVAGSPHKPRGSRNNSSLDNFDNTSTAFVVAAVVEYTGVPASDSAVVRLAAINAEFEGVLRAMTNRASPGFTSDGGNAPVGIGQSSSNSLATSRAGSPSKVSSKMGFGTPERAINGGMDIESPFVQYLAPIQTIQMLTSLSEISHFEGDAARLDALCSHIGVLAAGALRASCAVFLLPTSRGTGDGSKDRDVVGHIWSYHSADGTVRPRPSKLTIGLRSLLDTCTHTEPSPSEESMAISFHSLRQRAPNGAASDRSNLLFAPVPTHGRSLLGSGECCRLLCPIYLPSSFGEAEKRLPEAGILEGYLLCERDLRMGPADVAAAFSITKLASFVALAHAHRGNLILHQSDKEQSSKALTGLQMLCNHQERMLEQYSALGIATGRLEWLRLAMCANPAEGRLRLDLVWRDVQALVSAAVPRAVGASSAEWAHFSSEKMLEAFGAAAVMQAVDQAEPLCLDTDSERQERAGQSLLITIDDVNAACVSYRLQTKRCYEFSITQATALAFCLLRRVEERRLPAAEGAPVVALHCCAGLHDCGQGPVCVILAAPSRVPPSVAGLQVNVPDEGVWALVVHFNDLQSWGAFAGLGQRDLFDDRKQVGGLMCARACIHALSAVVSTAVDVKDRFNSSLRAAGIDQLQQVLLNGAAAIKKVREDGAITDSDSFAGAIANALSTVASTSTGESATFPNVFDLAVSMRQLCADKEVTKGAAHRVLSARLFYKAAADLSRATCDQWWTVNRAVSGPAPMSGADVAAALLYALREQTAIAVSLPEGPVGIPDEALRLQSALDKVVAPNNTDIMYARRLLILNVEEKGDGTDAYCGHAVVALYVPLCRRMQKEFLGAAKTSDSAKPSNEFMQLFPAVLEIYLCVPISSFNRKSVGWNKVLLGPIPHDGFLALYPSHLDDDIFRCIVNLREVLSSEYRSVLLLSHSRQTVSQESASALAAQNVVAMVSACLQELHAEGGKLAPTLRRVEPLLGALSGGTVQRVYLHVTSSAESGGPTTAVSTRTIRPVSTPVSFTRGRVFSPSERTSTASNSRSLSPQR